MQFDGLALKDDETLAMWLSLACESPEYPLDDAANAVAVIPPSPARSDRYYQGACLRRCPPENRGLGAPLCGSFFGLD